MPMRRDCMPMLTISISEQADAYLRRKVPTHYGHGKFISELLAVEAAKEQVRAELASPQPTSRESWEKDGIRVD